MSTIPDRWVSYKACGKVIEGTRFICFKVPLLKDSQDKIPGIREIWDVPAALKNIPKLGSVIDLTNTRRYYNPKEFEDAGVDHKKIMLGGRMLPTKRVFETFAHAVDKALKKDDDSLVGVHCTHGLNRTGYMVCRYMRDHLKIPAQEAIKKFENARGYQIERDNFIDDLLDPNGNKKRKMEGEADRLRPGWSNNEEHEERRGDHQLKRKLDDKDETPEVLPKTSRCW